MTKYNTDKVVQLQGKTYVLFEGLLEIAHREHNIYSIETEMVVFPTSENNNTCLVRSVCKCKDESGEIKSLYRLWGCFTSKCK